MLEVEKLAQAAVPAGCSLPADKVFLLKSSKKKQKGSRMKAKLGT